MGSIPDMSSPDSGEPGNAPGESGPPPWEEIARDPDFRRLLADKIKFVVPATVFFLVYYFALPVLVGYAPELMAAPVWGDLNAAYLFALSQFFMAWTLAAIYVRAAMRWDREADGVLKKFGRK